MMNKYEEFSFKRKQLQSEGEAPEWYSTAGFQLLSEKNYLLPAETPKGMYTRLAKRAAELTKFKIPTDYGYSTWETAFFDILWKGYLSPSTPVLSNLGTDRGHPIACEGTYMGDSISSWYESYAEIAKLTQRGYGTSACLDNIRFRGAPISKGGEANGIMQPAGDLVRIAQNISQGSSRRGAIGIYLNPLHPDFDELADQILADDDGWNIGWNITDEFEELFTRDPERADAIWKKMLKIKLVKGKGYFFFVDKVNRHSPDVYQDKGLKVKHSNLCVTGDTKILTKDKGYTPIKSIAGTTVSIWDGKEYVDTPIFKTSDGQKVLTVKLSNSIEIKATTYHRWYVEHGFMPRAIVKQTDELREGDRLIKFELNTLPHGTNTLLHAYENGFHSGDTVGLGDIPRIDLHGERQTLLPRFSGFTQQSYHTGGRVLRLDYAKGVLRNKYFIPDVTYSIPSRLTWLAGYLDATGVLVTNDGVESIQVTSANLPLLQELLLMLQELGTYSTITETEGQHTLAITGNNLVHLLRLGFNASIVQPTNKEYDEDVTTNVTIVSIEDNDEIVPTYCGTNQVNETLMLNGVQTLNCSEIELFNDKDHSFTCVLSSMNVSKYDEWKDTKAVEIATVFLDAVIEDMLDKAKDEKEFERAVRFTKKSRALGLGQLGIATYFQQKGWEFGDLQSTMFNQQLTKLLYTRALSASKMMAKELGEPEWLKGYGRRNTHLLAFPPTMSTSVIMGGISQGVEPVYANVFEQDTAGGTVYRVNPVFLQLMKDKGMYNAEVMRRIANDNGSVQAEDWLSKEEKAVFKTSFEINQEVILRLAGDRTKNGLDQGQSINLYFTAEEDEEEIARIHDIAFKDENIEGLYYVRTLNGSMKVKVPKSTCAGCEG